jgi:F-type H+-transporting ATPase subunit O
MLSQTARRFTAVAGRRALARGFAKKAKGGKKGGAKKGGAVGTVDNHIPPISLFGLHARYANALFASASKAGSLSAVEAELNTIKACAAKDPNFADFLGNPTIARKVKGEVMGGVLEEANSSDIIQGFFSVVASNGRLGETVKIIDTYATIMQAVRGEVEAVVTSSEPLSDGQVGELRASIATHLEAGQTLLLSTEVNPEIMGGLQVLIGDKFMDLSVASRVNAIHGEMMKTA